MSLICRMLPQLADGRDYVHGPEVRVFSVIPPVTGPRTDYAKGIVGRITLLVGIYGQLNAN